MEFLNRRALCGACWLMVSVLMMVLSLCALHTALPGGNSERLSGRYDGDGPAFGVLERLRDEAALTDQPQAQITGWTQTQNEELTQAGLNATLNVDALWVDGSAALAWDVKPVRGNLPVFGRERDAALSADAAFRLFGSTAVLDQTIVCRDKEYRVACVFQLPKGWAALAADPGVGLVMLPAAEHPDGDAIQMQAIECKFVQGFPGNALSSLEQWLGNAGIAEPDHTENWADTRNAHTFFAYLPWLGLALMAAWALASQAYQLMRATVHRFAVLRLDRLTDPRSGWRALLGGGMLSLALLALAAGVCILPGALPKLPPAYIPTRWSDVAFGPQLAQNALTAMAKDALREALRPDLTRGNLARFSALLSISAIPALLFASRAMRQAAALADGHAPRHTLWLAAVAMSAAPISLFIAQRMGYAATAPPGAWLLPVALVGAVILGIPTSQLIRMKEVTP